MRKSVLVFAVIALALAGGTVYFVQQWLKAERAAMTQKEEPKKVVVEKKPSTYVLIAAKPLPVGTFVKPGDIRWQAWPDQQVPPQFLRKPPEAPMTAFPSGLVGSVVRKGIAAGQPIVGDFVVRKGERGFLAAVLQPGMRAVSINIDDATGISGLVFPGDRVDAILTHETVTRVGDQNVRNRVSETIMVNIRVLALDQRTNDLEGKPVRARTVTLEVTPRQAEIIAVAARMGAITLTLRSLAREKDDQNAAKPEPKLTASAPKPGDAKPGDEKPDGSIPRAASHMTDDPSKSAERAPSDMDPTDRSSDTGRCVAGEEGCEEAKPKRGTTFITDREFSRFLSRSKKDENINVIRGNKTESVDPNQGPARNDKDTNGAQTPVTRSTTNTAGEQ